MISYLWISLAFDLAARAFRIILFNTYGTRRLATLVAFVLNLEAIALDDALDLLDILITEIFADATRAGENARLRPIKDLDEAAGRLGQVCGLLLERH
jgi:hypothetical protein